MQRSNAPIQATGERWLTRDGRTVTITRLMGDGETCIGLGPAQVPQYWTRWGNYRTDLVDDQLDLVERLS